MRVLGQEIEICMELPLSANVIHYFVYKLLFIFCKKNLACLT